MDIPEMTPEEKQKKDLQTSSPQLGSPTQGISTSPQTDPPTELTPDQKLIEEYKRKELAYLSRQRDQDEKFAQLTNTVNALVTEKNKKPEQTPDEAAKEFYKNPRKVIQEIMDESVAPLNQFKDSFQTDSKYAELKSQFKADPRYAAYFQRQGFEGMIDQVVGQAIKNGGQVTPLFVESAITHTVGQIAVGTVAMPDPIADANRQEEPVLDNRQIPPYLQPSAPPQRKPASDGPKRRQLSENEDRIRRENGQSLEDWWAFMEMDSKDVISSRVGLEEKK